MQATQPTYADGCRLLGARRPCETSLRVIVQQVCRVDAASTMRTVWLLLKLVIYGWLHCSATQCRQRNRFVFNPVGPAAPYQCCLRAVVQVCRRAPAHIDAGG